MDFQEIWEENKRWILGVAIGFVVYLIGGYVISSMYDVGGDRRTATRSARDINNAEFLDRDALAAAKAEAEQLSAATRRLEQALVFEPAERFSLAGKGDPFLHFSAVQQSVREALLDRADGLGVELLAKDLEFTPPTNRDEIERTLLGLGLLEQAVERLFAAHRHVRGLDVEALGLVGIGSFKVVGNRRGTARGRRPTRGGGNAAEDRLRLQQVSFEFRADEPTLRIWLEQLHAASPPIALEPGFKVTTGRAIGDPLVAKGTITAVRLVESE